jgi:hypothetical protein
MLTEGPICPYCSKQSKRVGGDLIYPHRPDLSEKQFWYCHECSAYVGCHPNTAVPLGSLANAELRTARSKVHATFDPIWKSGTRTRSEAYAWLSEQIGVATEKCHIGMFDLATCERALAACARAELDD